MIFFPSMRISLKAIRDSSLIVQRTDIFRRDLKSHIRINSNFSRSSSSIDKRSAEFSSLSCLSQLDLSPSLHSSLSNTTPNRTDKAQEQYLLFDDLIGSLCKIYYEIDENLKSATDAVSNEALRKERMLAETKPFLYCRQVRMEEKQSQKSNEDYKATVHDLMKMGKGTSLKLTQHLVVSWHENLLSALQYEVESIKNDLPGADRSVI
jgi:hypothetical protein